MGCWGEMKSPQRGFKHRYVCMMMERLNACPSSLALGDKTGERSSPLFKVVWYYHTQLATIPNGSILAKLNLLVCHKVSSVHDLDRTHLGSLGTARNLQLYAIKLTSATNFICLEQHNTSNTRLILPWHNS